MDLKTYLAEDRGAQSRLARALGCQPQLMWQWQAGRRMVPAERCPGIERESKGQVRCETLRPDVVWHRVPDPAWPWHPAGRPLIDVTRHVATTTQETRNAA